MRERFIENLEEYGDMAKRKNGAETSRDRSRADDDLYDLVGEIAHERGTPIGAQRNIYHLQEKKQEIMTQLHEQLADLDHPENGPGIPDGAHFVRGQDGTYRDLEGREISLGALLTDADWGIDYYLDPRSVPREVRKKFLIERARLALQDYLDRQIITNEMSRSHTDAYKQEAYRHIREERIRGHESMGHVAEKMVRNFLKKLSYDFPAMDFDIEKADVYQDVQQKIDFIVRRRPYRRGVTVDMLPEVGAAGIQFTTNLNAENIGRKQHQIDVAKKHLSDEDVVDDIVMVSISLREFAPAYDEWKKHKTPGGPEALWSPETQKRVFGDVMKGLLTPAEIDQQWRMVMQSASIEKIAA